jgi:hypothetical protein
LALRQLRRGLERVATERAFATGAAVEISARELTRELEELIAALDRRVPRVERAGEAEIAREAAALRARARARLDELANDPAAAAAGGPRKRV